MSPYTMQDAAEERRLEDAAWQDAIDADLSKLTQDIIFKLSMETLDRLQDAGENEIREAISSTLKERRGNNGSRYLF